MDGATVSVAVVASRTEAELIVGMLRSHGLRAAVSADDAGGEEPQLQLQGVRVLVASSGPLRARAGSCAPLCAKRLERRPDLGREQLGLFPGGEVAALAGLIEVGEVGDPFSTQLRGARKISPGERSEADRERDLRRSLPGRTSLGSSPLPVRPGRRRPRCRSASTR